MRVNGRPEAPRPTTKERIFEAFNELVVEKRHPKKVSVTDICERAGVSRQSFYNHFEDKYEIGQWFFDAIAGKYLYEAGRSLSYHDANLLNNRAFAGYHDFIEALFQDSGYQSFLAHARRGRRATLEETITDYKGTALTREMELLLEYHVEAETFLITQWICRYPEESPERIAAILDEAIPAKLLEVVGEPTPGCHGTRSLLAFA